MKPPSENSIFSYTLEQLQNYCEENGYAKYNADQVFSWIYKKHELDISKWTNVSKKLKSDLEENFLLELPKILWNGLSKDGTRKFLVGFSDKESVECVAIPGKDRLTLCISSQVGCAIGCTFCHTGTMGLKRHLHAGEIVGQYLTVTKFLKKEIGEETRLSNIVFMGQGEPLHNFDNVRDATINFTEPKGLGLGQRKITLSTSGLVNQIEKLWDFPPVNIAISLHAAHDKIRTELMPINKVYDLKRLFEAIKKIPLKAHRRITYEYLLIANLNDRKEDIDGLCRLLDKKHSKINLIPFNEYPESSFKKPSAAKVKWFQNELINHGHVCTTRVTKGDDILAACGQLKSQKEEINLWDGTTV